MKKIAMVVCLLICANTQVEAQSWVEKMGSKTKEKVVQKVEQRIENKIDETTDKVLDKSEDALKKNGKKSEKTTQPSSNKQNATESTVPQQKTDISYAKYDFIPGNEVIFEDDLKGEQKGEFPSKWDLLEGNAEIAQVNGENVLAIIGYTYITPLFKDKSFNLPDEFTIEFDILIDEVEGENSIEFTNESDETIASSLLWKESNRFLFKWNITEKERDSEDTYDNTPGWHHFALSFNKRAMKVYMDSKRVANIPNVIGKPCKVKIFARGSEDNSIFHIKNIRIAKGAVPLYDRLMTDGKIITYGITFDIGKATLKPQSMGTINEIFAILQKYPELRFSVEGHTDNTGNANSNQALSDARSKAVCDKLKQMGIDANRLSSKGFGMSKPVDSNETPEGRAKNRRVEFVKY